MCVCGKYTWVWWCMPVCMHAEARVGYRMSSLLLSIPLRQAHSLDWKLSLPFQWYWLASKLLGSTSFFLSSLGLYAHTYMAFYMGDRDLNSNLHVCTNTLISLVFCIFLKKLFIYSLCLLHLAFWPLLYPKGCCIDMSNVSVVTGKSIWELFQKMKN